MTNFLQSNIIFNYYTLVLIFLYYKLLYITFHVHIIQLLYITFHYYTLPSTYYSFMLLNYVYISTSSYYTFMIGHPVNFQNSPIGFPSLVPSKANIHWQRGSCCCCRGGNPHRGVARKKNSGGINGSRPCIWIRLPICTAYTFWIITRLVPPDQERDRRASPFCLLTESNLVWFNLD